MLLTVAYDLLHYLPPVVYGLLLSSIASISLAVPALHTPESLAGTVIGAEQSLEKKIRLQAEESVKTNVGVVGISVGFALQIFAVIGMFGGELFQNNVAAGVVPSVLSSIFLATAVAYVLNLLWGNSD